MRRAGRLRKVEQCKGCRRGKIRKGSCGRDEEGRKAEEGGAMKGMRRVESMRKGSCGREE